MIERAASVLLPAPKGTQAPPGGLQSRGVNKIVIRCENSLLHAGFCTAMVLWHHKRPYLLFYLSDGDGHPPPPGAFDPTSSLTLHQTSTTAVAALSL